MSTRNHVHHHGGNVPSDDNAIIMNVWRFPKSRPQPGRTPTQYLAAQAAHAKTVATRIRGGCDDLPDVWAFPKPCGRKRGGVNTGRPSAPVVCVETGQEFPSHWAAAEWVRRQGYPSADYANIHKGVTKGWRIYGYHWRKPGRPPKGAVRHA